jgi:hypothetical protein
MINFCENSSYIFSSQIYDQRAGLFSRGKSCIARDLGEFFGGNELILKRRADCFGDERFHLFFANSITPVTKQFVLPQFFEKRCFTKNNLQILTNKKRSSTLFFKGYSLFQRRLSKSQVLAQFAA